MSCGIYKIQNNINGKIYVGQSISIQSRWRDHISRSKTENTPLYLSIRKYGLENFSFDIIEECEPENLDEKEIYWIKEYNSTNRDKGYNILSGGSSGSIYSAEEIYKLWDEGKSIQQIINILHCSESTPRRYLMGYKNYSSQEASRRGNLYSEKSQESFNKIYQYDLLGNYINEYESFKAAGRAVNGDFEVIRKAADNIENRKTAYNFQWSREKIDKMEPIGKGQNQLVKCIETNEIFPNAMTAAKAKGLKSKTGIRNCCNGTAKTAGKLHWCWY